MREFAPHRVWVPISPTQFESADWVVIMREARVEITTWIEDQGLRQGYDCLYDFVKCLYKGIHCHVLHFENPSHAVLFKLRFGGVAPVVRSQGSSQQ